MNETRDILLSGWRSIPHSYAVVSEYQCLELLRRARPTRDPEGTTVLGLADLELDLVRRRATRAGQRLDLTAKEFALLTLLVRRQGEVLSRTEIAEQVWDMNFDSATNVIDVAVRRLRSKLDAPFERTLLRTARGMGYVLEARDE